MGNKPRLRTVLVTVASIGALSVLVARTTALSLAESAYALIAGLAATYLPAGEIPLGTAGDVVNIVGELTQSLGDLAGLSQEASVMITSLAGSAALIMRYRNSS